MAVRYSNDPSSAGLAVTLEPSSALARNQRKRARLSKALRRSPAIVSAPFRCQPCLPSWGQGVGKNALAQSCNAEKFLRMLGHMTACV